jgi:hypothetical protein
MNALTYDFFYDEDLLMIQMSIKINKTMVIFNLELGFIGTYLQSWCSVGRGYQDHTISSYK